MYVPSDGDIVFDERSKCIEKVIWDISECKKTKEDLFIRYTHKVNKIFKRQENNWFENAGSW